VPVSSFASRLLVLAGVVSLSGCFSFVQVPLDEAPIGAEYRVVLTRLKLEQLRDLDGSGLPESGPPLVVGTLVERGASEITLRVPIASRQVGFHQAGIERQIRVEVGEVVQIERRQLDRGRTALGVAGLVGLGAAVIFTILEGARFWDQNPDPPLPDALRSQPGDFQLR
jgi:hypothetical protein